MYAYITPHVITAHIHIQERGWDSIGVMDSDWQDKGPDACRARREIYNACNGRIVAFHGEAFLVEDTTNFMLLGGQGEYADYCKATESIALTEVDAGFQEKRDLLTEHLRLVSGAGQCGARKFRWLKAATDCRPGFV